MYNTYTSMPEEEYPEEIDLSNNNLKITELDPFIKTLRPKLLKLSFRGNALCKAGIICLQTKIVEIKDTCCTIYLTTLNLEGCKIGDKGGSIFIKECLPHLEKLQHLNLNNNELSTMTGHQLAMY